MASKTLETQAIAFKKNTCVGGKLENDSFYLACSEIHIFFLIVSSMYETPSLEPFDL